MVGAAGPVDPALVAVEKNAKKEFTVAEEKIRQIAAEYLKKNSVNVPFEIHISEINRIDLVQEELEKSLDLMLLISNHQSYSEASGGIIGYPNLIEHVACPLLVIPDHSKYSGFKSVVFATDYHPEDIDSLKHMKMLLGDSDEMNFTVLHNQKDFEFSEQLKWTGFQEIAKEQTDIKNLQFKLKSEKDMLHAIESYADEKDPDLLALLKEKRGFFEQIFNTSETKSVLTYFHKPVLVYHEQ